MFHQMGHGTHRLVRVVCFWAAVLGVVAVCSGVLAAWPRSAAAPWHGLLAMAVGILIGISAGIACGVQSPFRSRWAAYLSWLGMLGVVLLVWSDCRRGVMDWRAAFAVPIGIVTCVLWAHITSADWFREHTSVLFPWNQRRRVVYGVVGAIAIGVVCVMLQTIVERREWSDVLLAIFANPGGIFAFITGVATMAGVYYAILSLMDMGQTITTFESLARQLTKLVADSHADRESVVKYLCYTPLTGSFAVADATFQKLVRTLMHPETNLSVVTLDRDDLKTWFGAFVGRRTKRGIITPEVSAATAGKAEEFLQRLVSQAAVDARLTPTRLRLDQMPGFYVFCSAVRAIVVAPFFLPLPLGVPRETQANELESVQMIGIETSSPGVVAWVNSLHDLYKDHVEVQAREGVERGEVPASEVEAELASAAARLSVKARELAADGKRVGFRLHVYVAE